MAKYNKDKIRTRRERKGGLGKTVTERQVKLLAQGLLLLRWGSGARKSCRYLAGWPFFFLFLIRGGISQRNSSLSPQ